MSPRPISNTFNNNLRPFPPGWLLDPNHPILPGILKSKTTAPREGKTRIHTINLQLGF